MRPSSSSLDDSAPAVTPQDQTSLAADLSYERSLLGLANATRVLLRHADLSAALPQALEHLRAALDLDRLYLCEHFLPQAVTPDPAMPEGATLTTTLKTATHQPVAQISEALPSALEQQFGLKAEALGPGTIAHPPIWQHWSYPQAGLERWCNIFQQRQLVEGAYQDFPPQEQQLLQSCQVQAALMVPIFVDETQLWGYLGGEDCQHPRRWSSSERATLVTLAENLGSAIQRQRNEAQIQHQAFHDPLTGLPNRQLLNHRLPLAIAHARRTQEPLAVIFLDLDRFKQINDTLGHDYGDQLLIKATQRLQACLREEDILARWGGDEFTLCLPNLQSCDDASKICQRLLAVLEQPFFIQQQHLQISGSIGIALYPQDGEDVDTLLRHADVALYRVKQAGRNSYQFFRAELNSLANEQLNWAEALRRAIHQQELQLHYQPQFRLDNGQICGLEALLRWQHPTQGLLAAAEFLPYAEQAGLMLDLGEWAIETVLQQIQAWQRAGIALERVCLNLSPQQFHSSAILAQIARNLDPTASIRLALEICEPMLRQDLAYSREVLQELHRHNVAIILQKFGVGLIGLESLAQLPLSRLKLDVELLRNYSPDSPPETPNNHQAFPPSLPPQPAQNQREQNIIAALLSIGHNLAIPVIAHGIESPEPLGVLRSLQCAEAQGHYLSPPLPADRIPATLEQATRSNPPVTWWT